MGFGTLFIGYFFLINISYYAYTDILAGMVMLLGLYNLSGVNESFRRGAYSAIAFSVIGLFEISLSMISLFGLFEWISAVSPYVSSVRFAVIFILSYFILGGIEEIAADVGASALERTAKASIPLSSVFLVYAAFELPFVSSIFGKLTAYVIFALLLSVVAFTVSNLITIYKAYMQICMPEDLKKAPKKSKLEFMNRFYDSIEKKSEEYAKYKLTKKQSKRKK